MSSKRTTTGLLSLDPHENAIVVNYEVTTVDENTGQVREWFHRRRNLF